MRKSLPLAFLAVVGCSGSPAPAPESTAKTKPTPTPIQSSGAAESAVEEEAAAVAGSFLQAVLAGEGRYATGWLTEKAAAYQAADPSVLAALGMQVQQLSVGEVRLLDEDEAAVVCLITEVGQTDPSELCCLLKLEAAGWRVCGVASDDDSGEPAVMSFEGPGAEATAPPQLVTDETGGAEQPRTAAQPGAGPLR